MNAPSPTVLGPLDAAAMPITDPLGVYIRLSAEQLLACDMMQQGNNVFLTGAAGTGKSMVTTAFIGSSLRQVDVAATTGIAAINLRDQFASKAGRPLNVSTIYRWAGIGLGPKVGQSSQEFFGWWSVQPFATAKVMRRVQWAEVLVIDEISMLPGRLLNYLDFHCQRLRQSSEPFGGIQVIAVGDFLQLPPVDKDGLGYDWAFQSTAWKSAGFRPAVLTHVHRQADPVFAEILNDFRMGEISKASGRALAERVSVFPDAKIPRLMTHNRAVDKWNQSQLDQLPGETVTLTAVTNGPETQRQWLIKNMVTPLFLNLKPRARVMVTANIKDEEGDLVACNGTMATVTDIHKNKVDIMTDDGLACTLGTNSWQFDSQDAESAKFFQIPLRLAWASTIHKSQGLTLPSAYIDIRSAREPGQAYVAISRIKSLDGLHLREAPAGLFVSEAAIAFHRKAATQSIIAPY